ncbi:MAG: hypothetical protein AB7D51_03185 [Desulfovibrionaceae bacterium]|jgi:hypothetical protein
MPNMDYPGPCLSCSGSCGLWDDDRTNDRKDNVRDADDTDE